MASAENQTPPGFFTRLKQHHIYRVVTVYAVAAWVLIQLSNSVFPDFGVAKSAVRMLIMALLLGFPVVLVMAWMLIKPKDAAKLSRWQKQRWKLGAILSLVVLVLVVVSSSFMWRVSARHAQEAAANRAAIATRPTLIPGFDPPANSLVVLPFTNLSGDPKQQYFSDGITEELTNALGENTALRVIAWETASTFRNIKQSATDVGKMLNVANILHGSILRQGNQVRVTAELVNTVTGYQLWSDHYDETLKNIFAVQDHISQAIASALQIQFAGAEAAPTLSPKAHDWVLKGLAGLDHRTAASMGEAKADFERAIALDPHYAEAYAGLAHAYLDLSEVSTMPLKDALLKARAAAKKALMLDSHNVSALVALGVADASDNRLVQAKQEYERALALDPSNEAAHVDYGLVLPLKLAIAQTQEAVLLDPQDAVAQNNLAGAFLDLEEYQQALAPALAMIQLSPDDIDSAFYLAFIYQQLHQYQDSVKAFELVKPATVLDRQLVAAARLAYQSLLEPGLRTQALSALESLRRAKLSPAGQIDLLQLYLALGEKQAALQLLSGLCPGDPAGCSDLAINPVYQPLHGDPHFERFAKHYTTITLQ